MIRITQLSTHLSGDVAGYLAAFRVHETALVQDFLLSFTQLSFGQFTCSVCMCVWLMANQF